MTAVVMLSPADWFASQQETQRTDAPQCIRACGGKLLTDRTACDNGCDLAVPFRNWSEYEAARAQRDENPEATRTPPRVSLHLPRVRSLQELYADPSIMAPARMVIPGIVEEGTGTLLVAPPKTGKSHLASDLAARFSAGLPALDGTPMGPGVVLWIATDEPLRRLIPRFRALQADARNVRVVAREGAVLTPASIRALLNQEKPDLLVIDTLSQLGSDNGIKPNDAESVAPFMKALMDAVQSHPRCGAVFIAHSPHHAPRAAGSVQWAAIADATLILRRPAVRTPRPGESSDDVEEQGAEDGRRILSGVTRWGGEQRQELTFKDGRYLLGSAPLPLSERIRALLMHAAAGPQRTSRAAIARSVGGRNTDVAGALNELIARGEARSVGAGPKSYIEATAAMALYPGSVSEGSGSDTEEKPEEVGRLISSTSSEVEVPALTHGKRYDDVDDPGYLASLLSDESAIAAEEVVE